MATEQHGGTGHKTATENPVEFSDPRGNAGLFRQVHILEGLDGGQ